MVVRAGIYTRISADSTGEARGVARQEQDCRALCVREDWDVTDVYSDSDVSAFTGVERPEYQRLVRDVAAGGLDVVVVWNLDRLHRDTLEQEQFLRLLGSTGVRLVPVTGAVDLTTDAGQFLARILGAHAQLESGDKRRRLLRMHEQLAAEGRVSGGGWRPFGYEADRVTVRESEAVLIREAAGRVLAGASLRSVARGWNAQDVTTTAGNRWSGSGVKRVLCSPRIAGLREHRGEIAGEAVWEGIIDPDNHHRLVTRLTSPVKRPERRRRYLLTGGLSRCGHCDTPLVARAANNGAPSMVCPGGTMGPGCGRLRIAAEPYETFIAGVVIEALDGPALGKALRRAVEDDTEDTRLVEELTRLQGDLEDLTRQHFTAPEAERLTRREYLTVRSELVARIDQVKTRLSRNSRTRLLTQIPSGRSELETAWETGDIEWRRSLVSAVIDHITIGAAVRGRTRFDPNRLTITWRA